MEYVLTTNVLSKQYKDFKALDNLSLHVPKGSIYGFVGKKRSWKDDTDPADLRIAGAHIRGVHFVREKEHRCGYFSIPTENGGRC